MKYIIIVFLKIIPSLINTFLFFVLAISSSVYYNRYGDFSAYWGPAFAIDSAQSSTWYGMFHSAYETYPWMQIALPAAATVTTVTLRSRCDANAWSCSVPNSITVEVGYVHAQIF